MIADFVIHDDFPFGYSVDFIETICLYMYASVAETVACQSKLYKMGNFRRLFLQLP